MASGSLTAVSSHSTPEISRDELQSRLNDPSLTIVDARPGVAYLDEHLPRAINLPMTEVGTLAAERLPDPSAEIAVYCASFT
jgi:rhodanese-related sulfurtransferase